MVMVHAPFAMAAVILTAAVALGAPAATGAQTSPAPEISVTEAAGVYRVIAAFTVPASPRRVASVLTDYERIPDFMPDVKTSQVLERSAAGLVVEQEAAAKFMMFTKRIHLVLEVGEDGGTIRFRDRCGKSFAQYEGAWRLTGHGDRTTVAYELSAKPSFDVPGFVLKRLLKRDAGAMIARLTAEIANRAEASK
jgi:ribosome-associated toxin RatA of RatAB toxin-antitoxin module